MHLNVYFDYLKRDLWHKLLDMRWHCGLLIKEKKRQFAKNLSTIWSRLLLQKYLCPFHSICNKSKKNCAEKRFDPIYSRNNELISGASTTLQTENVLYNDWLSLILRVITICWMMRKSLFWSNWFFGTPTFGYVKVAEDFKHLCFFL